MLAAVCMSFQVTGQLGSLFFLISLINLALVGCPMVICSSLALDAL